GRDAFMYVFRAVVPVKSARGLAQSKTLREAPTCRSWRQLLDCASPLALCAKHIRLARHADGKGRFSVKKIVKGAGDLLPSPAAANKTQSYGRFGRSHGTSPGRNTPPGSRSGRTMDFRRGA